MTEDTRMALLEILGILENGDEEAPLTLSGRPECYPSRCGVVAGKLNILLRQGEIRENL